MKCPGCRFENKPDKKFCTKCGAKLRLKCLKCGSIYTAVGDTTNLASRMQGMAKPGTVIVSEAPSHFHKAIPIFQEMAAENELALTYSGMGHYHRKQGNTEQAREYMTKALEIFDLKFRREPCPTRFSSNVSFPNKRRGN